MSNPLVNAARSALRRLGVDLVRYKGPDAGFEFKDSLLVLGTLRELASRSPAKDEADFLDFCMQKCMISQAQLFQDLFVQFVLGEKTGGFFVEFGATNGIHLSNTYSLERTYGWKGILAEPAKCWHDDLRRNRNCTLDFRCVWEKDGERLQFNQVAYPELSTIDRFTAGDLHAKTREAGEVYAVDTISLNSLLAEHRAPGRIDYLSVDTEGSEYKILSAFDFERHEVGVLTVEHNFTSDRIALHDLLTSRGFTQKFDTLSLWDGWYVLGRDGK